MIQSKTKTPSMQWKRAPLALAIAMALGSPVLHAQIQPSHISTDSSTEQLTSQLAGIELVVIDAAVEDRASLLKAVPHGAEWLVLDSSRDGMVQLAEIASRYQNISALHLLSHGNDGLLKLGNSELNQQNLGAYQKELATLAAAMAPGADLLLYGCEVAKTAKGEQFIQHIKAITGLDIAASNDVTQDSDWELEIAQGSIEMMSLAPEGYNGSLISIPPSGYIMAGDGSGGGGGASYNAVGGNGGVGGGDNDTVTGTIGNDLLFGDGSGGGGGASKYGSDGVGGTGGGGDDTLDGGAGNDILFGDGFAGEGAAGYDGGAGGYSGGGGGGAFTYTYFTPYKIGVAGLAGLGGGNGGTSGSTGVNSFLSYAVGGAGANGKYGGGGGGWSGNDYTTAGDGGDGIGAGGGAGVAGHTAPPVDIPDYGTIHTGVMAQLATLATLPGGAGADILDGGPGSDELFGMGGADTFKFEVTDAPAGNSDIDTIHDFVAGTDTIQLLNNSVLIDTITRDTILTNQTATPTANDRTLVYTVGGDSVTIIVKNIGNDLIASDVPGRVNTAPTVSPSIDAAVAIGGTFTVTENGFDADSDPLTFGYQWSANTVDIAGAVAATFNPTITEAHASITVTVTADDGNGGTSAPTTTAGVTVTNSNPTFNATPSISGTAAIGSTLSIINTATADADGDSVGLSYLWRANGTPIGGATGSIFNVTTTQAHALITVAVMAIDSNLGTNPAFTAGVTVINNNPAFIATPSISGTATSGSTLSLINTATTDADGDIVNLSYQWQLDGADIAGANSATYDVLESDRGGNISSVITADDGYGGSATATTVIVTIPAAASSGGGGAISWLSWMMGLLLLGSRRLSNRRK